MLYLGMIVAAAGLAAFVAMPLRAFLFSLTVQSTTEYSTELNVAMPLRAFLFSLLGGKGRASDDVKSGSQCPCGRFCFLSLPFSTCHAHTLACVAMPLRAFLFSLSACCPLNCDSRPCVAMPLRAFLFSLAGVERYGRPCIWGRNALAGVFVFSRAICLRTIWAVK